MAPEPLRVQNMRSITKRDIQRMRSGVHAIAADEGDYMYSRWTRILTVVEVKYGEEHSLMHNSFLWKIQPCGLKMRCAVSRSAEGVHLDVISCSSDPKHGNFVSYLHTMCSRWCLTHGGAGLAANSDVNRQFGDECQAPDVCIFPRNDTGAQRDPRFIIEVEVNHRSVQELRALINSYFRRDAQLIGALGIQIHNLHATAALWHRMPDGVIRCTGFWDFGEWARTAAMNATWQAHNNLHALAPGPSDAQVRRFHQANGVWDPKPPIVHIPLCMLTSNMPLPYVNYAFADELSIDLGAALDHANNTS